MAILSLVWEKLLNKFSKKRGIKYKKRVNKIRPLLYFVGKKLLKLVWMPLNVGLRKIDASSALLFLLMEMSKNDILLSFSSLQVNITMTRINVFRK